LTYIQENFFLKPYYWLYHGLILIAWCLSILLCWKRRLRYVPLCILLGLTLFTELVVEWLVYMRVDFTGLYHLFVMAEYTLVSLFFAQIVGPKYKKWILYSVPFFVIASTAISYLMYGFRSFPGMNINLEGFLVCIISSYTLLNLREAEVYDRATRHPDFWISFGWLIFFTGTFFTNGLYSYLLDLDRQQALALFALINKPLNIVLYSCLIIGFLCAIQRRSISPSS